MKRIMFLFIFFGLQAFALAHDSCSGGDETNCSENFAASVYNLDEEPLPDSPLDDSSWPLPERPIPPMPEGIPYTPNTAPSSTEAFYWLCISVNPLTHQRGIRLSKNPTVGSYLAWYDCRRNSNFQGFCNPARCQRTIIPILPPILPPQY